MMKLSLFILVGTATVLICQGLPPPPPSPPIISETFSSGVSRLSCTFMHATIYNALYAV